MRLMPFFAASLLLIFLRIANLGIRLSDTNIYFYTSIKLLEGNLLYKDIFFTNFPVFPYLSIAYLLLALKQLPLYYLTSTIELIIISFLVYHIAWRKTKEYIPSLMSALLYMFSFIVLSTSEHQTGVFTATFFALLGYYLLEKKKFFTSGIFISLAVLTKAYLLPIAVSFFIYLLIKREYRSLKQYILGVIAASAVVLGPFLLIARSELINDVFSYSLTRSAGLNKLEVVWFFVTHDIVFLILLIFSLITIKKNLILGLISLCSIVFVLFYQDVYYLYLNFIVPFLCLSLPAFIKTARKQFHLQKYVLPSIVSLLLIINFFVYVSSYRSLQKMEHIEEMIATIKKQKPAYLYGINDITPGLAYFTGVPLLDNIVDTNENIFRKGFLDADKLTDKALSSKTIIIAHGASYPQQNIDEKILEEIFNKDKVLKNCRQSGSFPINAEGVVNRINLFSCF